MLWDCCFSFSLAWRSQLQTLKPIPIHFPSRSMQIGWFFFLPSDELRESNGLLAWIFFFVLPSPKLKIFRIEREGESQRYKPFKQLHNRQLLWHGSRTTNFAGILSQGLRIAPPEAPVVSDTASLAAYIPVPTGGHSQGQPKRGNFCVGRALCYLPSFRQHHVPRVGCSLVSTRAWAAALLS